MNKDQSISAYPLAWPFGEERTRYPQGSRFGKNSIAYARDLLLGELKRMNASQIVISSNLRLRNDGLPASGQSQPRDAGVAVYFTWKSAKRSLACDKWRTVEENLYAIALTIEAMRGLDRWGVSKMLDRAFQGFMSLPPPTDGSGLPWWEVLECDRRDSLLAIETRYRTMAKKAHPDRGGSAAAMANLSRAIEEARLEKRL